MAWPVTTLLLLACDTPGMVTGDAGIPLPDAAVPADAGAIPDAGRQTPVDAGEIPDAAGSACDVDGDGFMRDALECPRGALPPDCNDNDPRAAPAVVECRTANEEGCGFHHDLAAAIGVPEVGSTTTHTISAMPYGTQEYAAVAVPRAWGQFTRGLTVHSGPSVASVTLLPHNVEDPASALWLDEESNLHIAVGRIPGTNSPMVALARRTGEVTLSDARDGISRTLLAREYGYVTALGVAGREKPALVVAVSGVAGTRLTFTDEDGERAFMLPSINSTPWIVARGDMAMFASWGRMLHVAARTSDMHHSIELDSDIIGRAGLVALSNGYLAVVPTTGGLRAIRFPRCQDNAECAGAGVVTTVNTRTIVNGALFAMTSIENTTDLVAMVIAASDTPDPPQSVDVIFINGEAPATELGRVTAFGANALDGRTFTRVVAVATDNSSAVYGGAFLMVNALMDSGTGAEEWSTGFTLCSVL